MAALGASETDQLGRQVVSRINLLESFPQAPNGSDLGSHHREAARIVTPTRVDGVGAEP